MGGTRSLKDPRFPVPQQAPPTPPPDSEQTPQPMRAFGEGVVSQKPLDEVVLEYLVENARKRRRNKK